MNMPYASSSLRGNRVEGLGPHPYGGNSLLPSGMVDNPRSSHYFDSQMNDPRLMNTLLSEDNDRIPDDYEDVPLTLRDPDNIVFPPSRSPSVPRTYPRMNDGLGSLPADNGRYGGYNMRRDPSGGFYPMHSSYSRTMDDSTHPPFCHVS